MVNRLRVQNGDTGVAGRAYEKKTINSFRGKATPGSGAIAGAKGDFKLDAKMEFLFEVKTSLDASFTMQLGHLVKISEEAQRTGRVPAFNFAFVLPTGRPRPNAPTEWVAVPKHVFEELINGR